MGHKIFSCSSGNLRGTCCRGKAPPTIIQTNSRGIMRQSKLSLIVLTILFSSISLFAQTDSVKCNSQIQFHLINGYSLSYLSMLSPTTGLRFKVDLGLNGSSSNLDSEENHFNSGTGNNSIVQKVNNDGSNSSQYVNLTANYFWLSNITKDIRLYLGMGPLLNFSRSGYKNNYDTAATSYYPASKSSQETTSYSFGLGFQGAIGLECRVTDKISLLAELNLNGTYSWSHSKDISEDHNSGWNRTERTSDGNSWSYGLNNIKIGIAYNF